MAIENGKILNVRIKNKYDSYDNWTKSELVLEAGEIAIAYTTVDVTVDNVTVKQPALLMKVGDGEKAFGALPWLSAKAADVLTACKSEEALTTFVNNVIADAGIATDEAMQALAGRVTTVENDLNGVAASEGTEAVVGLKDRVTTAEGAIDALELLVGNKTVEAQIEAAITALNLGTTYETITEADKVRAKVAALEAKHGSGEGTVEAQIEAAVAAEETRAKAAEKANADAIDAIEADYLKAADKTELQGNIDTVSGKVTTLIGEDTGKSVRTIANEELAKQLIAEGAAESLDTLQEIAAWIQDHPGDASAMNKAIEDLETLVGTLPTGITATTIVGYIQEVIATEKARAEAAEKANADAIDALEALVGEKSVATQIAEAITAENLGQYATDAELAALAGVVGKEAEGEETPATGLVGKVATLEGKMTAAEADIDSAEADIIALQAKVGNAAVEGETPTPATGLYAELDKKVETVTAAAGSGLKATRTNNDVVIEFDETVTLVFDCGGAEVTTA